MTIKLPHTLAYMIDLWKGVDARKNGRMLFIAIPANRVRWKDFSLTFHGASSKQRAPPVRSRNLSGAALLVIASSGGTTKIPCPELREVRSGSSLEGDGPLFTRDCNRLLDVCRRGIR